MANFSIRIRGARETAARATTLIYFVIAIICAVVFSPLMLAAKRFDEDAATILIQKLLDAIWEA